MDRTAHSLAHRTVFALADAAAVRIRCTGGTLWLTLDHDLRDIILGPGDSFSTTEHKRALLYALEPATFALSPVQPDDSRVRIHPVAA